VRSASRLQRARSSHNGEYDRSAPSAKAAAAGLPDGSHDLYFGPKAPPGKESNWVETIPGKSWFPFFRLYCLLQPWFDQTWKLNEFEPSTDQAVNPLTVPGAG
jgi:hypothetical protein